LAPFFIRPRAGTGGTLLIAGGFEYPALLVAETAALALPGPGTFVRRLPKFGRSRDLEPTAA